jgi:hypothetical protein
MWIVLTSSGQVAGKARKYGTYRKVALVKLRQDYVARDLRPAMISDRAQGVVAVRQMGTHSVGKTARCAYQRALAAAEAIALDLNTREDVPLVERVTFGGSA